MKLILDVEKKRRQETLVYFICRLNLGSNGSEMAVGMLKMLTEPPLNLQLKRIRSVPSGVSLALKSISDNFTDDIRDVKNGMPPLHFIVTL